MVDWSTTLERLKNEGWSLKADVRFIMLLRHSLYFLGLLLCLERK